MGMIDVQKALKEALQTEKDAMDFYLFGAEQMDEERARKTFELLAREEAQHARMFYDVYKGDDIPSFEDFIKSPPDTDSDWWVGLQKMMLSGFDERKALELAMEQEEALEKALRETAATIDDPKVRAIYEANANSTHHHAVLVEEDYKAMLGMST